MNSCNKLKSVGGTSYVAAVKLYPSDSLCFTIDLVIVENEVFKSEMAERALAR